MDNDLDLLLLFKRNYFLKQKIPNVATNIINILVFHTPHIVWPREIDSSFHTFHSSLTASLLGYNMEIYYYHGYNKINLRPVSL